MIKSWNHYLIVGFTEGGSGSGASLLSLFGQALVVAGGLNIPPWKRGHFSVLSRKFSRNFNFWAYLWRNNRQWQPREEHPIWWKGKSLRPREDWSLLLEGGRRRCWWWLARRPEKLEKVRHVKIKISRKLHKFLPRVLLRDLPLSDAPRRGPRRYSRKL